MLKQIQLRLLAVYNSKEKAIGICSLDLRDFITGKDGVKIQQKVLFQKCFDKNASITIEVRAKEQFNAIRETILEESENNG